MSKNRLVSLFRYFITLAILAIAVILGIKLWHNYMDKPWTRDGRIRVDVTLVAPDVSGIVSKVYVKDNQYVKKGEKLYEIDKKRFEEKVAELKAIVRLKAANFKMRDHEYKKRYKADNSIVSQEEKDNAKYKLLIAKEDFKTAKAKLDMAKLDLDRATVYSPSNSWISNLRLKEGDYLKLGDKQIALINEDSFWVYGYFEENKLSQIHVGDTAKMNILGTDYVLRGHVESIASGITDRDNPLGDQLLANVNPSFSWVRLAQRIPVRIAIDSIPNDFALRAGITCTIEVEQNHKI